MIFGNNLMNFLSQYNNVFNLIHWIHVQLCNGAKCFQNNYWTLFRNWWLYFLQYHGSRKNISSFNWAIIVGPRECMTWINLSLDHLPHLHKNMNNFLIMQKIEQTIEFYLFKCHKSAKYFEYPNTPLVKFHEISFAWFWCTWFWTTKFQIFF